MLSLTHPTPTYTQCPLWHPTSCFSLAYFLWLLFTSLCLNWLMLEYSFWSFVVMYISQEIRTVPATYWDVLNLGWMAEAMSEPGWYCFHAQVGSGIMKALKSINFPHNSDEEGTLESQWGNNWHLLCLARKNQWDITSKVHAHSQLWQHGGDCHHTQVQAFPDGQVRAKQKQTKTAWRGRKKNLTRTGPIASLGGALDQVRPQIFRVVTLSLTS